MLDFRVESALYGVLKLKPGGFETKILNIKFDVKNPSFIRLIIELAYGCLTGSHLEQSLRPHLPFHGDRDKSHILAARLTESDAPFPAEINRGDVTVHHERTIHGSGANSSSDNWRRAWVIAYRTQDTVEHERSIGFTHSHNDKLDVLNEVGKEIPLSAAAEPVEVR